MSAISDDACSFGRRSCESSVSKPWDEFDGRRFGFALVASVLFEPAPSDATTLTKRRCTSRSTRPGDADRVVALPVVAVAFRVALDPTGA